MLPHLPGDMSYNLMAVFEFYTKLSPWKGLDDCSGEFDYFLISSHKYNKTELYQIAPLYVNSYFFGFLSLLFLRETGKRSRMRNRPPPEAAKAGSLVS